MKNNFSKNIFKNKFSAYPKPSSFRSSYRNGIFKTRQNFYANTPLQLDKRVASIAQNIEPKAKSVVVGSVATPLKNKGLSDPKVESAKELVDVFDNLPPSTEKSKTNPGGGKTGAGKKKRVSKI